MASQYEEIIPLRTSGYGNTFRIDQKHTFKIDERNWSLMSEIFAYDRTSIMTLSYDDPLSVDGFYVEAQGVIEILDRDDEAVFSYKIPRAKFYHANKSCTIYDTFTHDMLSPLLRERPVSDVSDTLFLKLKLMTIVADATKNTALASRAVDFKSPKPFSNLRIIVGDTTLYSSKEVLAAASPVFANMLYCDFEENKRNEIQVEDVSVDDMKCLLDVVHFQSIVSHENVMSLLATADKYLIDTITKLCENYLISDFGGKMLTMASHAFFEVACEYRLYRLQQEFIATCPFADLRKLHNQRFMDTLPNEVLLEVIDRLLNRFNESGSQPWEYGQGGRPKNTSVPY